MNCSHLLTQNLQIQKAMLQLKKITKNDFHREITLSIPSEIELFQDIPLYLRIPSKGMKIPCRITIFYRK